MFTGPQEERESAHEAFMHALESAKPVKLRMPGMQQFAAAVSWEGRYVCRSILLAQPAVAVLLLADIPAAASVPAG